MNREDFIQDTRNLMLKGNSEEILGNIYDSLIMTRQGVYGYFVYMGDKYHISDINGDMLTGWVITNAGKIHTLSISKEEVLEYTELKQ